MLTTAKNMFEYFLAGIRKERTVVITPDEWTSFINPIVLKWVYSKLPDMEFNQKRIDDLEAIKVMTDGVQYPTLPCDNSHYNLFDIPYETEGYPRYLHGISAQFGYSGLFKIDDEETEGGGGGAEMSATSSYEDDINSVNPVAEFEYSAFGKVLRSDKRLSIFNNPYRQPNAKYVYFENRGNQIYVISDGKPYNRMILEYYKYPDEISYNGTTDNAGSFGPAQNEEIMDMAIVYYLENVSDPRIQTNPALQSSIPK